MSTRYKAVVLRYRRLLPLAVIAFFGLLALPAIAEPARLALVMGNAAYPGDYALRNPVNDAIDVAAALSRIGWQVSLVTDADRRGMNRSIVAWRDSLSMAAGASALFYYAGHGMQIEGANYLLPVKTDFDTVDDIKTDAIPINIVTEALEDAQVGVSLLILDACRDNPFARKMTRSLGGARGLSVVQSGGGSKGSAIMFSTSPGDVALDGQGRNGVFTAALLAHIDADLKLEDVFRKVTAEVRARSGDAQKPWINASLSADFYLLPEATRIARAEEAARKAQEERQREIAAASAAAASSARAEEAARSEAIRAAEAAKAKNAQAEDVAKVEAALAEAESARKAAAEALALAARLQAEVAAKPSGGAALAQGKALLSLQSDPPGMRVLVDGEKIIYTPEKLELEAGAHSFLPEETYIDGIIYAGQALQWITVPAGTETRVPLKLVPETATLELKHVPPGYELWIGEESWGTTPMGPLTVQAGTLALRFEKPGQQTVSFTTSVGAREKAVAAFGRSKGAYAEIPRGTVKLDGKKDSWQGIDPFFEGRLVGSGVFQETKIVKAFICRDEKYIYWRLDFEGANPIRTMPKGVVKEISLGMRIDLDMDKFFNSYVIAGFKESRSMMQVFDPAKDTNVYKTNDQGSYKASEDMVVMRFPYSKTLAAHLGGQRTIKMRLKNAAGDQTIDQMELPAIYVRFEDQ